MDSAINSPLDHASLRGCSTADVRRHIRAGNYRGHTAGLAAGKLQGNLVILPADYALDFFRFCQRNPKPCPVVAVSNTGDPDMFTLGVDIDIRSDVPAYYTYRNGRSPETSFDIKALWRDDFVAFVLGCSFTFEHALQAADIPLWHIDNDTTVPMFTTNIPTVPAGPFGGNMVVSMRLINEQRLQEVIDISERLPMAHGAPIHWGNPADIGIPEISSPDWGDPSPALPGTIPVFWACGVTPQVAIRQARPPICITHKPGHMLITDIAENAESPIYNAKTQRRGER